MAGTAQVGEEPRRVLVIDDSDIARAHLRRLLEQEGFEVLERPSAIGATRTILANGVNVVVVDISMPGLSGDKLVGVLRSNPRLQGLVIVVVSAKSQDELEQVRRSVDANAVVSKDNPNDLISALHRYAQRSPKSRRKPGDPLIHRRTGPDWDD